MRKIIKIQIVIFVIAASVLLLFYFALADTNLEGMEGHLSVPSAEIQDDEIVNIGWAQNTDQQLFPQETKQNYYLGLSLFPRVDFGGRYTVYPDVSTRFGSNYGDYKDRSTFVRLQLMQQNREWPDITIGAIDLFGQAKMQETYFGVVGKDFNLGNRNLRVDLGYGDHRYDGFFAGATYDLFKQLALKMEYDTESFNYGLYYQPNSRIGLHAGIVNNGDLALGANLKIPLYSGVKEVTLDKQLARQSVSSDQSGYQQIATSIVKQGFEDVRVGFDEASKKLTISLSQRRFRNHFAGIGLAATIASIAAPSETEIVNINYLFEGNPAVTFSTNPDLHLQYLNNQITTSEYQKSVKVTRGNTSAGFNTSELNDSQFTADYSVSPSVDYVLGLLDAPTHTRLSVMPQVKARLWDRLSIEGSAKLPIQSDMPWPYEGTNPYMESALGRLNLGLNNGIWLRASGGLFERDLNGFGAEIQIPLNSKVNNNSYPTYIGASYRTYESNIQFQKQEFFMGRVTQTVPSLNLQASFWAGQFLNEDEGYLFDIRRLYGNTMVNCYITRPTNIDNWEGGFRFTFPLDSGRAHVPDNINYLDDYLFNFTYRSNINAWQQIPRPAGDIQDITYTIQPEYILNNLRDLKRMNGYVPGSF